MQKKKKYFASPWFCDSNCEINTPLTSSFKTVIFLCLETDYIMTFSKSSHDLASSDRKGNEKVFLPWPRTTVELLKLPKLHLNCKYLCISLKFSRLSVFEGVYFYHGKWVPAGLRCQRLCCCQGQYNDGKSACFNNKSGILCSPAQMHGVPFMCGIRCDGR